MAQQLPQHRRIFGTPFDLVLLSMAAGSSDAAGYLGLGKVFTANMTGNIVLLGLSLSEGRDAETWRTLFSLLSFVIGTCIGGWMCRGVTRKEHWTAQITWVISLEAVLLLIHAVLAVFFAPEELSVYVYPFIALLGLAMGLQGAAASHLGIPGVVTTVVTGTLTSLFTGIMKAFEMGPHVPSENETPGPPLTLQACVVVAYCGGAAISGLLMLHARAWAGFFPAVIVLIVILTRLGRSK
jgi:uncharacterized membrane protein YoaK (UPF0700 family)